MRQQRKVQLDLIKLSRFLERFGYDRVIRNINYAKDDIAYELIHIPKFLYHGDLTYINPDIYLNEYYHLYYGLEYGSNYETVNLSDDIYNLLEKNFKDVVGKFLFASKSNYRIRRNQREFEVRFEMPDTTVVEAHLRLIKFKFN